MKPKIAFINRFTRRDLFVKGAAGGLILAGISRQDWLAAQAQTVTVVATPAQTEGPYFVDEKLNRADIRVDPSSGVIQAGFPLVLAITISRITNGAITPLSNAYVDIWHCNASG